MKEPKKIKLVRITTVPLSLRLLITGQPEYMERHGFEVTLISSAGEDWDKMPLRENIVRHKLNMERRIAVKKDVTSLFALIKLLKKIKPDIVHTHTPKAGLLGMTAAWIAGVPIRIHTLAGMPAMTAKGATKKILFQTEKLTYLFSNEVWINSKFLKQYILKHKLIAPQKAHMILNGSSNGIDLKKFNHDSLDEKKREAIRKQFAIQDEDFIFLSVGRMVNDKGINELVSAFEKINQVFRHTRLFLLGPFEKADALPNETVEKINCHSAITHIEWSDEVEYFMAEADCFIHASHREGFPNVILQAAAMGLPIICSKIPGNIDIVEHENEGYIYPVKNSKALQEVMEQVLNNRVEVVKRAQNLQQKVFKYYDRVNVQSAIKDRYLELLQKKGIDVSSITKTVD
jgi:glycosyltransferase involved in cell wall biosynthesis